LTRWSLLAFIVALAAMVATPATVLGDELTIDPHAAVRPIPDIWERADGPAARGGQNRDWLWGPALRSISHEPYRESPGGARQVFYFDKARMEINNPNADWQASWYATAGLLARDLIAGQIQVGDNAFVQADAANVPVAGDLINNPSAPTFATFGPLASIGDRLVSNRSPKVGPQPITALLHADGSVDPNGVPDGGGATVGGYDERLGHNLPSVFQEWMGRQAEPGEYVVGYPLTEPYWVDTVIKGAPKRVLVQAFERRVLTYTPDNPDGWKVEAGNVALQYRAWLGLKVPDDQNLAPLADEVPFGELLVDQALQHGVDPYLFAALAKVSSGFDPLAESPDGRRGFLGVRAELLGDQAHPLDPKVNAAVAAARIADLHSHTSDWRAVLAD
jgi:hypothetical protein